MSQQQHIKFLKIFEGSFACKIVLAAKHLYPGKIQRLFRLQICPRRKSSISWKYSKTFSPAKLSQSQINERLEIFNDFFACKNFLAATHHYSEKIQRVFRLQKCLSRKPYISWKYSKTFSPAKMSQLQIIDILEIFKEFFRCKNVLAANHIYPGNIQRLFLLQKCLSCKSSISWKYSKTFSAANLSQPQIIYILEIFKDFFACKLVLAANHRYPGNIQRLFRLQNCLSRKLTKDWKYSTTFSPAKISQQQPIIILEKFKEFSACKIALAANHRYPGNIQRLFRLQKFLSSNPSMF